VEKTTPQIRDFKDEDFEALCRIDRICFPEEIAFSAHDFRSCLNHPGRLVRIAERFGQVIGFILALMEKDSCVHVMTLDVLPEFRRQSIGSLLMDALHEETGRRGITTTILEVSRINLPAQQLYRKFHYKHIGTLPGYYSGKEDAYCMVRIMK
jgi:[ribosomal protein S18]-alanine N-acetyltransferase